MPEMLIATYEVKPLPIVACKTFTLIRKHMNVLNTDRIRIYQTQGLLAGLIYLNLLIQTYMLVW